MPFKFRDLSDFAKITGHNYLDVFSVLLVQQAKMPKLVMPKLQILQYYLQPISIL